MIKYSQVLVGIDYSACSEQAARRAAEIAAHDGAALTLLHVIDYFPEDMPLELIAPENVDPAEFLQNDCAQKLEALIGRIGHENSTPLVSLSTHSARHEIVPLAEHEGADLIVLGSHGRRGIRDYMGSTVHAVLHAATCDVLVVRGCGS